MSKPYLLGVVYFAVSLQAIAAPPKLTLSSPTNFQIFQRQTANFGTVLISGSSDATLVSVEARLLPGKDKKWQKLETKPENTAFSATLTAPAGGWYRLEVRGTSDTGEVAQATVEKCGVGEIFVVAGQSNSANHGEMRLKPTSGMVVTMHEGKWRISNDPQPGASGNRGSFIPPLGDALAKRFEVPIGFVACGIGATSVREWLPTRATFPNPPTIESRVRKLENGHWESKGAAYRMFTKRLRRLGPKGFRAVLWHQGESDANQRDSSRTLPGKLYREYLEKLILESNKDIAGNAPWFAAQVSYHVPGDEASADIRAAQASLWKDGVALQGPDSDALKGKLRENNGQGVHFSAEGLRQHGQRWFDKVSPWLEKELANSN